MDSLTVNQILHLIIYIIKHIFYIIVYIIKTYTQCMGLHLYVFMHIYIEIFYCQLSHTLYRSWQRVKIIPKQKDHNTL